MLPIHQAESHASIQTRIQAAIDVFRQRDEDKPNLAAAAREFNLPPQLLRTRWRGLNFHHLKGVECTYVFPGSKSESMLFAHCLFAVDANKVIRVTRCEPTNLGIFLILLDFLTFFMHYKFCF
jgi:hypothetical protein